MCSLNDNDSFSIIKDVYLLQKEWKTRVIYTNCVTKKKIVEICMPFKLKYADRFNLKDSDILDLARGNLSVYKTFKLLNIDYI